jgi:hypothetical protein
MFQGRAELDGKPPVGDENQTYHVKNGTPAGALASHRTKGRHHDHVPGKRKGVGGTRKYILRRGKTRPKVALLARFFRAQCSKQEGKRVCAGRDRKSRQADPGDFRNGRIRSWKALRVGRAEVDHETDDCQRFERNPADSEPANFDETPKCRGRAHREPPVRSLNVDPVIADEAREGEGARFAGPDQREGETRFA